MGVELDHMVKVMSARLLYYNIINSPFVIKKYFVGRYFELHKYPLPQLTLSYQF